MSVQAAAIIRICLYAPTLLQYFNEYPETTNTKTETEKETKKFREHRQRVTLETCDLWDNNDKDKGNIITQPMSSFLGIGIIIEAEPLTFMWLWRFQSRCEVVVLPVHWGIGSPNFTWHSKWGSLGLLASGGISKSMVVGQQLELITFEILAGDYD